MLGRLRASVARDREPVADENGRLRWYCAVALVCAGLGLSGYLLSPESQAHAATTMEIEVAQAALEGEIDARALALHEARAFLRTPIKLIAGPWEFVATRAALGTRVDLEALEAWIRQARDPASALRVWHFQHGGLRKLSLPIPARLEGERAQQWLLGIGDQVQQRVRDARVDVRNGTVQPQQDGVSLDVHGTLDLLDDAIFNGKQSVEARLLRSHPKRTAQDLVDIDLSKVLGAFETRYNALDTDRTYNLRVAARHVDGVVLMPGEVFDFNAVVGERSEANGFRPAPVIAGGELADGVGGGTCQIAGTLYAAAYFAGLPFPERNTHTRPSSYLRLGLDATVAYPKLNLKIQNDLPTPIAFGVQVGHGRVKVEVRGSKEVRKQVSFVRRLDEVTPYTEITREDPSLPRGIRVLTQRGVAGFRITSFRLERDLTTQQLVRERSTGNYPPTTQIWRVGSGATKPENFVAPANDPHNEYTTDEYLVLTQGEGITGLEETVKREGRTGFSGWTKSEGMPQVE